MSLTATPSGHLPDHSARNCIVREEFVLRMDFEPDGVWSAPGRLNLLGEYIDFFGWLVSADAVAVPHLWRVRCVVMVCCARLHCRCRR